ncbi:class F sortase [Streptomyces sp. 4N509B]|uniref:class F sortase n=1 Tax=Streptomyces sp. 4N509B TaxID=3457413 RepID=UPI003FD21AB0
MTRTPRRVAARLARLARLLGSLPGRACRAVWAGLVRLVLAPVRGARRLAAWFVAGLAAVVRPVRALALALAGASARTGRATGRATGRGAARCRRGAGRCWRFAARCGRTVAAPLRLLSTRGARNRHQRLAVRSRRLEVAAVVVTATVGVLAGIHGPVGGGGVREARASSMIADGVSRPGAVDAPGAPPNVGSTANLDPLLAGQPATLVAAPLERSVPVRVRIPQLNTDVEVIAADLSPDGGPPTPSEEDAMRAAWYAGGVSPGERGAAIIVGHLDTFDGPAAFAGLGQLRPGETIEIVRADGETAVFAVDSVEQYPKTAFPDERVYGSVNSAQLRLITCGGRWTSDGGYDSNIVAYAHLTPRSATPVTTP